MRITFVTACPVARPSGHPRVIYEYASRLASRDYQVTVVHGRRFSGEPPEPNPYRRLRRAVRNIREASLGWGVFGRAPVRWQPIDPRVRLVFSPNLHPRYVPDADVVIACGSVTAEDVASYPPSKGKGFFLVMPNYPAAYEQKARQDQARLLPLHKIVIARFLRAECLELGCKEEEVSYVPIAIDHSRFRLLEPIESRPKRVAMFYSWMKWKGSAEGLAALEAARKAHPDLQAVLFGPTWRRASIPSWIEYRRNVPERELVGDIYNRSRILLFPSWYEGFGLIPAEAMACGCAVVSTDCMGVREFADHEANALLSPPRDIEALTKNLLRLLDDDALRARLAQAGVDTMNRFTWERSTDLLEAALTGRARQPGHTDEAKVSS